MKRRPFDVRPIASGAILFALVGPAMGGDIPFAKRTVSLGLWSRPNYVSNVDLDADGDIDLISSRYNTDTISWWESDGGIQPLFTEHVISNTAEGPGGQAVADLDGDGDLDLAITASKADAVYWYESDGGVVPQFTRHTLSTGIDGPGSVFAADLDGDNDLDLVAAFRWAGVVTWYENDGASPPSFTERTVSTLTPDIKTVFVADLDADGDADILAAYDRDIAWFENDGAALPGFTLIPIGTLAYPECACAVDIDLDGDLDAVAAPYYGYMLWYENDGATDPSYSSHILGSGLRNGSWVTPADIDGDNDIDIAFATSSSQFNQIGWLENVGGVPPVFESRIITTNVAIPNYVGVADIDADGDLDITATGRDDGSIVWFEHGRCQADIDRDGAADVSDFSSFSSSFGSSVSPDHDGDMDGDGDIDVFDFAIFALNFGCQWP